MLHDRDVPPSLSEVIANGRDAYVDVAGDSDTAVFPTKKCSSTTMAKQFTNNKVGGTAYRNMIYSLACLQDDTHTPALMAGHTSPSQRKLRVPGVSKGLAFKFGISSYKSILVGGEFVLGKPFCRGHSPGPPHFHNRVSEVPRTTEAPLESPEADLAFQVRPITASTLLLPRPGSIKSLKSRAVLCSRFERRR